MPVCRFGCLLKLLASHDFQSLLGGKLFRFLFASACAGGKYVGVEQQLHGKPLVVIRAGLTGEPVLQRFLLVLLHDLLEHGLVVLERAARNGDVYLVRDEAQHERARRLDAAVQIDRAQKRLGRIGQDGRTLSAAAVLLAVTQTDLLRNTEFPRDLAQRAFTHDRRTQLGRSPSGSSG